MDSVSVKVEQNGKRTEVVVNGMAWNAALTPAEADALADKLRTAAKHARGGYAPPKFGSGVR